MKALHNLLLVVLLILFNVGYLWATNKRSLVLVTSTSSTVPPLSVPETRKLFLGVPLEKEGVHPIPLLNISDPVAYQVFLQKVEFMSANIFENQMLSVVFRLGGKRPESYSEINDLVSALQHNPGTVTYLWDDQVLSNQHIKSVSVLWQGSQE